MKRSTLLKLLLFVGAAAGTAKGQVINFHNASQGTIPGYNQLYYGQGAYVDTGNNVWNGFSAATYAGGGPGSTLFTAITIIILPRAGIRGIHMLRMGPTELLRAE